MSTQTSTDDTPPADGPPRGPAGARAVAGRAARLTAGLALTLALWAGLPGAARAQEEEAGEPLPPPPPGEVVDLPQVEVRPPRTYAGPGETGPEVAVTPLREAAEVFDVPRAVSVLERGDVIRRRMVRSLPDALARLPSVMIQKTAPLQASPYIRGFTGYRNLALIDGIRFNHSAFRDGPNQYWSTIDQYGVDRLELVRGPGSVLYGSDAIGGVLNVIPLRRTCFAPGFHLNGRLAGRAATAEDAYFGRVGIEGNWNDVGFIGGVSTKSYGDIESGGGTLPGTGGADELDGDIRFDVLLGRDWRFVAAYQHVQQRDAPRTHRTVDAVPFRGTTVGSELQRDLDQDRDLAYARILYEPGCGPIPQASLGVSWHRHQQERDRLRTGDRRDISGFDLQQTGVQLQVQHATRIGEITWGIDYYHDEVDSFRRDYVGGVLTNVRIQGPLGDEGTYDLLGAYVQDRLRLGCFELIGAARFTYAAASADRVEDPNTGGVIQVDDEWTSVVGSLEAIYHLHPWWNVYASASQAFRAPTLYDLTAFEATSVFETPSPGLDPEDYVTFELGVKTAQPRLAASASVYATLLDDTIVRSPTGNLIMGTPEVRKDNVGDGWIVGVEAEATWQATPCWQLFANVSWMDGERDEVDEGAGGAVVANPLSRMKPLTGLLGVRWEPPRSRFWAQAEVAASDEEDRLSLRDQADTGRIPPDGTPGWVVLNLRAGARIGRDTHLGLSLENLTDENYRIHGSGQNEPGFNVVAVLDVRF